MSGRASSSKRREEPPVSDQLKKRYENYKEVLRGVSTKSEAAEALEWYKTKFNQQKDPEPVSNPKRKKYMMDGEFRL